MLAVFTAFAYAELVTKYPSAGGAALYVHKAYRRPFLTFIVAFAVMLSGITSASTLARAFGGDYLGELFGCSTSASAAAGGRWTPGCCRPSSTRRTIEARRGLGGRFLATLAIGAVERLDLPVRQDQVDRLLV